MGKKLAHRVLLLTAQPLMHKSVQTRKIKINCSLCRHPPFIPFLILEKSGGVEGGKGGRENSTQLPLSIQALPFPLSNLEPEPL